MESKERRIIPVLPGYTVRTFNKKAYIVPQVLEPATEHALASVQEAIKINAVEKAGGVSNMWKSCKTY